MNRKDLKMLSEAYETEILKEYSADYFLRKARSKRLAKEDFFKALNAVESLLNNQDLKDSFTSEDLKPVYQRLDKMREIIIDLSHSPRYKES
jgi:hypothetical protein